MYDHLKNGGISVQMGSVDQTIEKVVNKDTHTAGRTKRFSFKSGAVNMYYLTAEYTSTCLRKLRQKVRFQMLGIFQKDFEPSMIQRDVQSLTNTEEKTWVNLFAEPNELMSGSVTPADV